MHAGRLSLLAADLVAKWRRQRFVWGETDCIMATCNYVRDVTGVDPAKPWRGMYTDESGAKAIYGPYGGPLALFRHGMALAGIPETEAPTAGCPVVCDVMGHEIAGVYLGNNRAAFMAERGCVEMRARILGAWQI
jgi:hypothetical protein